MAQVVFDIRVTAEGATVSTASPDAYQIKGDLKARGYRFVADGKSMPTWSLFIPRSDMAAAQAEVAWLKASGYTWTRP